MLGQEMSLRGSILVSLMIVAGFTGFGFLYTEHPFRPPDGPEPVIAFGGVGVGVALCVLMGFAIIGQVRKHRLPRYLAGVLLLVSSGLSILTPLPVIGIAAAATSHQRINAGFDFFHGEDSQWVFVIAYGFWVTLAVFAVLLLCVFTTGRSQPSRQGDSRKGQG